MPSACDTSDTLMRALSTHALTSDCFGAPDGTSTLPGRLRMLLRSALVPSSGCRNRSKADAETVAEVRNARSHPYTPARACACGRARGTLARRVVTQALNLDDVAFVLWWLAFAALTNIGNDPNATVVLEVLIMRARACVPYTQLNLWCRGSLRLMLRCVTCSALTQRTGTCRMGCACTPPSWLDRCETRGLDTGPADGLYGHGSRCVEMRTFWTVFRSLHRPAVSTQHTHRTRLGTTSHISRVRARRHVHARALPLVSVLFRAHLTPGAQRYSLPTAHKRHPRTNTHAQSHRTRKTDTQPNARTCGCVFVHRCTRACIRGPCGTCLAGDRHRRLHGHAR